MYSQFDLLSIEKQYLSSVGCIVIQLAFLRIYRKYLLWLSSLAAHIGFNFSRIHCCWPSMSETYISFVGFTFISCFVFIF